MPHPLVFRVTKEMFKRVENVRRFYGWSRSQLMRVALSSFVEAAEGYIEKNVNEGVKSG